jgi:hypothetical protein
LGPSEVRQDWRLLTPSLETRMCSTADQEAFRSRMRALVVVSHSLIRLLTTSRLPALTRVAPRRQITVRAEGKPEVSQSSHWPSGCSMTLFSPSKYHGGRCIGGGHLFPEWPPVPTAKIVSSGNQTADTTADVDFGLVTAFQKPDVNPQPGDDGQLRRHRGP